jgi:arylsulfatase A-like enzyme
MYGGCLGPLASGRPSPVERLATSGYTTGGFSTSPLLSKTFQYNRGFDHFDDLIPEEKDPFLRRVKGGQAILRSPATHFASGLLGLQTRPARLYVSANVLTARLCEWIDSVAEPFFAWVHYMDVHWPYHLEENLKDPGEIAQAWRDLKHLHDANWNGATITEQQRDHYIRLYEQAVAYTDAQVGSLLDYLDRSGLAGNTAIIVVADHGEEFLEHGRWGHWEDNLYDEILKVPLIISTPDNDRQLVVDRQVRTLDLMPTILEMCGCSKMDGLDGASFAPLWREYPEDYQPVVSISEMWRDSWHIIAVRTEAYKYIWDSKQPERPRLYDLKADPGEKTNLASELPQVVAEMGGYVEIIRARMEQTSPELAIAEPDLDADVVRRLRDLGYLE